MTWIIFILYVYYFKDNFIRKKIKISGNKLNFGHFYASHVVVKGDNSCIMLIHIYKTCIRCISLWKSFKVHFIMNDYKYVYSKYMQQRLLILFFYQIHWLSDIIFSYKSHLLHNSNCFLLSTSSTGVKKPIIHKYKWIHKPQQESL